MNPSIHDQGGLQLAGLVAKGYSGLVIKFGNGTGIWIAYHYKEMYGLILGRASDICSSSSCCCCSIGTCS